MLKRILGMMGISLLSLQTEAQVSGVVYRDYNGNGTRQTTAPTYEPGVPGIVIEAYNAANVLLGNTTSAADGTYSLPFSGALRIECVLPASGTCADSTIESFTVAPDGHPVRLISAPATAHFGLRSLSDHVSSTNPDVFIPRYVDGDPLMPGTSATTPAFLRYTYSQSGTSAAAGNTTASAIGSVWGTAYSRAAKKVFAAAFLKRQVGLGPLGSGGIYLLQPNGTGFNVQSFYDMDANGYRTRAGAGAPVYGEGTSFTLDTAGMQATYLGAVDPLSGAPAGLGVIGSNGAGGRNLPAMAGSDAHDPAAFDQVGKVGLGGMDISADGRYLFVVNFYDRKVYRLELNNAANPTSVISVSSFALPAVPVTNGVLRPWALRMHRGQLYVGAVASGENGGVNIVGGSTDLYAHVFVLNQPTGAAVFQPAPVLSFPLNYAKGPSLLNYAPSAQWYPWNRNSGTVLSYFGEQTYPTPALSSIAFSDRGDMIMGFTDRSGHQYGFSNYQNLNGPVIIGSYDAGGDILVAGRQCGSGQFTLESNGQISSNGTTLSGGIGNGQGPGGGEFFFGEFYPTWHSETALGTVNVLRGDQKVLAGVMAPINDFSGGTVRFSTSDGSRSGMLQVYANPEPGTFAQSNGLGEIEIAGDLPAQDIISRVWFDQNGNGVQDAGESGMPNVSLQLFADFDANNQPDGAALATANSAADGLCVFNTVNVTDGDPSQGGNQPGPQADRRYLIRVANSDWSGGSGAGDLAGYGMTPADATNDRRDNDANLVTGVPQVLVQMGALGQNKISVDLGFKLCTANAGADVTITCTVPSAQIGTPAIAGEVYSWSPATGLSNAGIAQPVASPLVTTTYTLTVNGTCLDMVTVTVNKNAPVANAGSTLNLNCTTTSGTIGTAALAGNTYAWSPSAGLNNAAVAQPVASPSSSTIYTVTVTGSNGCTATTMVNVNVNTAAPVANAGPNLNLNCNTTSGSIGTTAVAGNSYAWSPSAGLNNAAIAQPLASPSSNTTYTVTVTGSNGCTATSMVNVNVNTAVPVANAGPNLNLNCNTTSGSIGTVAVAGNTYAWSPSAGLNNAGIAQPVASPSSNTIYTVTVTGSNGCTATSTVSVNVNTTAPVANAGSTLNLNCTTTSGSIGTVAVAGNTYTWSPSSGLNNAGIAQPVASPSSNTIYTVTVTGSNGCTATSTVSVNVNTTAPVANAGSTLNLNCTTTSGSIGTTAVAGNTYTWSPSSGLNNAGIAQPVASPSSSTIYTVTVTGSNGCTATSTVSVNVNTTAPVANAGSTLNLNCTSTSGSIGTAAVAGNTYAWSPSAGLNNAAVAQPVASPSSNTIYTVTVTGSNGCTATSNVSVNVNTTAPVANAGATLNLNCNSTSGSIGTAAVAGNTYAWSPSAGLNNAAVAQPVASPSSSTIYTVTVTGSNGCTATSAVSVNVNTTAPVANAGSTLNLNCTTTSGTIGTAAVAGNTYAWTPSAGLNNAAVAQPVASPSSSTIYTVAVTGSNGCTATSTVSVNVNTAAPVANAGSTLNLNCTTTSASIGTAAVAGNTYAWLPSAGLNNAAVAQPVASPSSSTTYTVTVTGSNGCTATSNVSVNVNTTAPVANAGATLNLNCTTTSGSIGTAAVAGNTYAWTPSAGLNNAAVAQPVASPSSNTIYTVTVTGSNGCTAQSAVSVQVNQVLPTLTVQNQDSICLGSFFALSATSNATVLWNGPGQNNLPNGTTVSPVAQTIYTVTASAANGCTQSATLTLEVLALPVVTLTADDNDICAGSTTTLHAAGALNYAWTGYGAGSSLQVQPSSATVYTVTGSDAYCSQTATISINVQAVSVLLPGISTQSNALQSDGTQVSYSDSTCSLLATIADGAGGNTLGQTQVQVHIENGATIYDSTAYAPRWYEITPTADGPANLVLYFSQADFNAYNAGNGNGLLLPQTGSNADPAIPRARILKVSVGPGNTVTETVLLPTLFWNGNFWELSFHVDGFSRFYLYAAPPAGVLPVRTLSATIARMSGKGLASVEWLTEDELHCASFTVQRSRDGIQFEDRGAVQAKGYTQGQTNYRFSDSLGEAASASVLYYRVLLHDADGKTTLSNTVTLNPEQSDDALILFPVPFRDELRVSLNAEQPGVFRLSLMDAGGRLLEQQDMQVQAGLSVLSFRPSKPLPAGTWLLQIRDLEGGQQWVRPVSTY